MPSLLSITFLLILSLCATVPVRCHAAEPFLEQTDLFDVGDGKYKSYRIPCLLVTGNDTILAMTSARKTVSDWADISIAQRRSTDGGKTWGDATFVVDGGTETADNPVAIWDREEKVVHFLNQVNYERVYYRRSTDDGQTYSAPVEITANLKNFKYDWNVIAPGPGHGIQLKNGRLIVPVWLCKGEGKADGGRAHRPSVVSTIYSDDHGKSWFPGEIVADAFKNLNETVAVEAGDGGVTLFMRNEDEAYRKAIAHSKDGATGWTKPELVPDLYTPICFAGVVRLPGDKSRILFSNPDSRDKPAVIRKWGARTRENMTLKVSYDEGRTWPVAKVLEPGRAGYSDLAALSDGTLLCLYERGFNPDNELNTKLLTIARFNLEWVTDGKDSLGSKGIEH